MSGITPNLSSASGREQAFRSHDTVSRSRLRQAQVETSSSAAFTFVTAEGDKVSLSADTLLQASYTRYDARGTVHGQRFKARAEELTLTSTQNSALSIEGDLSAEELQDIQEVVQQVSALAQEIFAGGKAQDFAQALDFDDLSTLQSFEATLEYSQSLSVSRIKQGSTHGRGALSEAPPSYAEVPGALTLAPPATSQLLAALQATDTSSTPAEPVKDPETSLEKRRPDGIFGTPQELFEAVKQAIERTRQTEDVQRSGGEDTQAQVATPRSRHSGVFRTLAETLSVRAAREGTQPQQTLSHLAAQFLQRLQGLGGPEVPPATPAPTASTDDPVQSAEPGVPNPRAA